MATSSRLNRVALKRSRRSAVLYLLLSVVFIFAAVKWGVPGFIQLLAWWSGADKPGATSQGFKVPPQTPALAPLPEATFSATIKVSGAAQPGVTIRLISNEQIKEEMDADGDGQFVFDSVALLDGKNILGVQAIADNGLESNIAQAEIIFDNEAPELEITEPADESDFFGIGQRSVQIKGTMKERGEINISGNFVFVGASGDFTYRLALNDGLNEITIIATDEAGNETSRLLRLRYTP